MSAALIIVAALAAYLLASAVATYTLWRDYLAIMNLQRVRDAGGLSSRAASLGVPLLVRGYLLDFIVNVFVLSWVLMELPRELTVTARLKRHNLTAKPGTWARDVVTFFQPLLDPFDPDGKHV